jgi:hypothetical protein
MAAAAVLSHAETFALNLENHLGASGVQLAVELALTGMIVVPETTFSASASIVVVKEQVQTMSGIPVRHQRLLWESSIVENNALVGDLRLPTEGAVLQLVVQLPPEEQVAEARQAMTEAARAINVLDIRSISEVKNLAKPPGGVDLVLESILHLRAGLDSTIAVDARGRVKDSSWKASQKMMKDAKKFLADLRGFKTLIENGVVPERNIQAACRIRDAMGQDFSQVGMARKSLAAACLTEWVLNIIRYHEIVSRIRTEFGEFDIMAEIREQLEH